MYWLTPIEVRTAIDVVDEVRQCQRAFTSLASICREQNKALKNSEKALEGLKSTVARKDSLTDKLVEKSQLNILRLQRELRQEKRKKKINALVMYGCAGVAIAEAIILITR